MALRAGGLLDPLDGELVVQVCGAGEIPVRFLVGDAVELSAAPRDVHGPLPAPTAAALLADLGLVPDDLAGDVWVAGCGLTFVHLPVVDAAVARARPASRPLSA